MKLYGYYASLKSELSLFLLKLWDTMCHCYSIAF